MLSQWQAREGGLSVKVDDPQTEGRIPMRYTTYRVVTYRADEDPYLNPTATCRHRFSDFEAMRVKILTAAPGVVVPPIPAKKAVNNLDPDFIESRRALLQQFVNYLVEHPLCASQSALSEFLVLPHGSVCASPVDFDELVPEREPALTQLLVMELHEDLRKLRKALKKKASDERNTMQSWMEISQYAGVLAANSLNADVKASLCTFSVSTQLMSDLTKQQATDTVGSVLVATLKRTKLFCDAIDEMQKNAVKSNAHIEKTVSSLASMRSKAADLAGKPGKEKKQSDLETQATDTERDIVSLRESHAKLLRTLDWEIHRLTETRNIDLKEGLVQLADDASQTSLKVHEGWQALFQLLESGGHGDGGGAAADDGS